MAFVGWIRIKAVGERVLFEDFVKFQAAGIEGGLGVIADAEILEAERFPRDVLNKGVLRLAGWLHRAGIRDYGYLIRQASLYYTYWLRSSGDWVAPPARPTPDVVAR